METLKFEQKIFGVNYINYLSFKNKNDFPIAQIRFSFKDDEIFVCNLQVNIEYQYSGVGTELMNRMTAFCISRKILKCSLSACPELTCTMNLKELVSWYERFGFKNVNPNLNMNDVDAVYLSNTELKIVQKAFNFNIIES